MSPDTESGQVPAAGADSGLASLGKRFLARIIDALIVGIPMAIVLVILPGVGPAGRVGSALTALAGFAYFVYLEGSKGRTFGKQALGMHVTDEHGGMLSFEASAKRNSWALLGIIPILGGILGFIAAVAIAVTISSDPRNQGIHDRFANALVR